MRWSYFSTIYSFGQMCYTNNANQESNINSTRANDEKT